MRALLEMGGNKSATPCNCSVDQMTTMLPPEPGQSKFQSAVAAKARGQDQGMGGIG